jgi:hypothetical protein
MDATHHNNDGKTWEKNKAWVIIKEQGQEKRPHN